MRTSQSPRPGMGLLGRGAAVRFSLVSRLTTLGDVRHPAAGCFSLTLATKEAATDEVADILDTMLVTNQPQRLKVVSLAGAQGTLQDLVRNVGPAEDRQAEGEHERAPPGVWRPQGLGERLVVDDGPDPAHALDAALPGEQHQIPVLEHG
jgi:hypothetical protein